MRRGAASLARHSERSAGGGALTRRQTRTGATVTRCPPTTGVIMQVPLEISFHNIDKSEWAEDMIRDHVARLEDI